MRSKTIRAFSRRVPAVFRLCLAILFLQAGRAAAGAAPADIESWVELKPYFDPLKEGVGPLTRAGIDREGDALKIRFWCEEPNMSNLSAKVTANRDAAIFDDDSVEIFLATGKSNGYYHIAANPNGAVWDAQWNNYSAKPAEEWHSGAKAAVQKGSNFYALIVSIPLTNLAGSGTTAPWRINLTRNRQGCDHPEAPGRTLFYTLHGWNHDPETWISADIIGQERVDLAALIPKDADAPAYDMARLRQLAPALAWIRRERLRIKVGWMMNDVFAHRRKPGKPGVRSINEIIDQTRESGFNVIGLPGIQGSAIGAKGVLAAGLYARQTGLRVFWAGICLTEPNSVFSNDYLKTVGADGKPRNKQACPLQAAVWDESVRQPLLRILNWEKDIGLEISSGCYLDVEPSATGNCYCDACFEGFLQKNNLQTGRLFYPPAERHKFLAEKGLLAEYQEYLQAKLADTLAPLRDEIDRLRGKPDYLFMVYPGHVFGKAPWLIRGIAKGLGRPAAPVILWADETYYTGYSKTFRQYQEKNLALMRKCLGYEPLYVPSIYYFVWEKTDNRCARMARRLYNPERVEREFYDFLQVSPGLIAYDEYVPGENEWERHLRFFAAFKKASDRLAGEGKVPAPAGLPPLDQNSKARLEKARQEMEAEINAWIAQQAQK